MALNLEHGWSWSFFIPVACMSFCWYLISIYWFWWMRRFTVAFSCSVLRSLGVRFQFFPKKDEDQYNALGKIHVKYENQKTVLRVTDPDVIKEMLAPGFSKFRNGEIQKRNQINGHCAVENLALNFTEGNWESIRKRLSLAFTPGKFRRTEHIMEHCCQELSELLVSEAKRTKLVDMKKVFDDFSMNMTFCLMFGVNGKASEDYETKLIVQALELLKTNLRRNTPFFLKDTDLNLNSFLGTAFISDKDLLKFEEAVNQIIKKRVENNQVKTDFLQLLMESFSTGKSVDQFCKTEGLHKAYARSKLRLTTAMPSSKLIARCLLLLTDGYRMISSVLSLIVYNLALNPCHQGRLRKEVKEVLLLEKLIDFNSISKMTFLDEIICETLRLYPPVTRLERLAVEECTLEEADLIIQKESEINIPICAVHKSSRHYPNPENFDPRRFAPNEWSKRHPYAFIPFGVGTRNCIGMKLSIMEIKICLVHLMKHFSFVKTAKTKIPLEFYENQNLTEPKEVQLHVKEVTV